MVLAYSGELLVLRVEVRAAAATRRRPLLLSAARRTCLPRRRPLAGRGGQLGERQAGGAPAALAIYFVPPRRFFHGATMRHQLRRSF